METIVNIPTKTQIKYATRRKSNKPELHSRFIGFICIIICIVTWICQAEIEPILFAHSFQKPYFLSYVAFSSLILTIIPYLILTGIEQTKLKMKQNKKIITEFTHINSFTNKFTNYHSINMNIPTNNDPSLCIINQYKQMFLPSITASLLSFLCNYLWFISLYYTIAAVNTTIYQSQCVFVLILSVFMSNQRLTAYNILSVISSIVGVVMISLFGKEKEDNSSVDPNLFGIISCLSATLCSAMFQVKMNDIQQKYFDQNNAYNKFKNNLFFQFMMGFNILIVSWPGFIILDYIGVEQFVFPVAADWISIIILSALNISFLTVYVIGITFSDALFMSIGTLLVVPFAYIVDIWLYHLTITPVSLIGSLFVIIGFILMQKYDAKTNENRKNTEHEQTGNNTEGMLSYFPDIDGLSVIDIGCKATAVLAIDEREKLLKENEEDFCNKYPHIDYLCRDVANLALENESYDFIFDHYSYLKLNNDEMKKLTHKYCEWVTNGGYIFVVCDGNHNEAFTDELISVDKSRDGDHYYILYRKNK